MKKFLLIVGIAAITVLSLSSCKKNCTCKESKSGYSQTIDLSNTGTTCSAFQKELNNEGAYLDQSWTCK